MSRASTYFGSSIVAFVVIGVLVIALMSAVNSGLGGGPADTSPEAVQQRIAPVAKLNTGEPMQAEAPKAEAQPAAAAAEARSGEQVYNGACVACHASGAAGAPRIGDAKAWAPRIDKGIDALLHSAVNGLNAMPPRGTCGNCSDEELKNAIEYMVSKSQ